jgi:hypothetical protein
MRMRPITALMAALALLAVTSTASFAQSPTPTPTASPTPTATTAQDDGTAADPPADASKEVKAVYTDYSRDGVIDVCDHTREVLQETLDGIEAAFDRDFPDFREAVKAGIQRHDKGKCDSATATPTATATATATASPDATATASPDDGTLPPATDDGGGSLPPPTDDGSSSNTKPEDGTLPPATGDASPTPAPPVATPTVAPAVPAATPTPVPTPVVVSRSSTAGLLLPGILIGVALLGAAALALAAVTGRSPRTRQAFSEAGYRFKGTWADFSDWLKFGR